VDEIFRWFNFIILAIVLYVVLAKILPRILQTIAKKSSKPSNRRPPAGPSSATAARESTPDGKPPGDSPGSNSMRRRNGGHGPPSGGRGAATRRTHRRSGAVGAERATERAQLSLRQEAAVLTVQIAEDILRRNCTMKTNRPSSAPYRAHRRAELIVSVVAKRYAKALVALAREHRRLAETGEQLKRFTGSSTRHLASNPSLQSSYQPALQSRPVD
jgi:hypothetical protein